jgi:ABC-type polysaccharide/polyol phosphate transport system ATPase subunit
MHVIELEQVSVWYRQRRTRSLKEAAIRAATSRREASLFYGLRDVTLTIEHGETVGIIGPNGAGKSTLLRVAGGIVQPSAGVVVTRGTIAPVMELRTGFDDDLSGRENVFFNGALLGFSRAYMRRRLDEIVAFAELEAFIDAPLRTYSNGMAARLAFAIVTTIDAQTVLLDEVIAVGDESFREKSRERIRRFVDDGATVVLVSHELDSLYGLCSRVIRMADGRVAADGAAAEVIERYRAESHGAIQRSL